MPETAPAQDTEALQYSPEDIATYGAQNGWDTTRTAAALRQHRDTLAAHIHDNYDAADSWKAVAKVDADTRAQLDAVRQRAALDAIATALPDPNERAQFADQLAAGGYDPAAVDDQWQPAMEAYAQAANDPAFHLPTHGATRKFMVGDQHLASFFESPRTDGHSDFYVAPEGTQNTKPITVRLPTVTDEEVKSEMEKKQKELDAASEQWGKLSAQIKAEDAGDTPWYQIRGSERLLPARDAAQEATQKARAELDALKSHGKQLLTDERLRKELTDPKYRDKVGEYHGWFQAAKGLQHIGTGALAIGARAIDSFSRDDNDTQLNRVVDFSNAIDATEPSSTRRQLEGGDWNHVVNTVQDMPGLAAQVAIPGGFAISAGGGDLIEVQKRISEAEHAGDYATANRLRFGRDLHAIATGAVAQSFGKLSPLNAIPGLKGSAQATARGFLSNAARGTLEMPLMGITQRALVDPILDDRPRSAEEIFSPVREELMAGAVMAAPFAGVAHLANRGRPTPPKEGELNRPNGTTTREALTAVAQNRPSWLKRFAEIAREALTAVAQNRLAELHAKLNSPVKGATRSDSVPADMRRDANLTPDERAEYDALHGALTTRAEDGTLSFAPNHSELARLYGVKLANDFANVTEGSPTEAQPGSPASEVARDAGSTPAVGALSPGDVHPVNGKTVEAVFTGENGRREVAYTDGTTESIAPESKPADEAAQTAAADALLADGPKSMMDVATRAGQVDSPRLQFSFLPSQYQRSASTPENIRYTHPIHLENGSRLSGENWNYVPGEGHEPVFTGYDKNGEAFTIRGRYVTPERIVGSRDSNKTAEALRWRLEQWRAKPDAQRLQLSKQSGGGVKPVPFHEFIEAAYKGKTPANAVLQIADAPGPVLQRAGLPAIPMEMGRSVLRRKAGKHSELDLETLKQLPEALNNPMAVYVSPGDRKAHAIVTTLDTPAGPVTLYSTVRERAGRQVLDTKTVFGKDLNRLQAEMRQAHEQGLFRHFDKAAFDTWIAQRDGTREGASAQHIQAIEGLKEFFAQFEAGDKSNDMQSSRAGQGVPLDTRVKDTTKVATEAARLLNQQLPGIVHSKVDFHANPEELLKSGYAGEHTFTPEEIADMQHAEAFFDTRTGHTIIFTDSIDVRPGESERAAVARVILHERVGHDGFNHLYERDAQFAKTWDTLSAKITEHELNAIAADYPKLAGDRNQLALEWFARAVEKRLHLKEGNLAQRLWLSLKSLYQRIFSPFAKSLRAERDLRDLIDKAREAAQNGTAMPTTAEGLRLQFSFAGPNAVLSLIMRNHLAVAQVMATEGKTPEEIRALTGWFPGKYDGKLRFEVPDHAATFKADYIQELQHDPESAMLLNNALDHPAFFAAYPEAKDIIIRVDQRLNGSANFRTLTDGRHVISVSGDQAQQRTSVLHELQHWIQRKEGFARGSSPDMWKSKHAALGEQVKALNATMNERLAAGDKAGYAEAMAARQDLVAQILKLEGNLGLVGWDQYQRTAGEIESRDVEARANLTPEQRAATAPYSSENIAPEHAIVLYGESGPQMSLGGTRVSHKDGEPFRVNDLATRTILTGSALPKAFHEAVQSTERERRALDQVSAQIGRDLKTAIEAHAKRTSQPLTDVYDMVHQAMSGAPGTNAVLLAIDPTLAERARVARNFIDDMSVAVAQTLPAGPLRNNIVLNQGAWMKRSYAAFDAASGWNFDNVLKAARAGEQLAGKPAEQIVRDAAKLLVAQNKYSAAMLDAKGLPVSGSVLEADMRDLMDRDMFANALTGSAAVRKNVSSLITRKDIPAELRALMGEDTNPIKRFANSTAFQVQFLQRHAQQQTLRTIGLGAGLFATSRSGVNVTEIPDNHRWSPLAGLWTTPQLWEALQRVDGTERGNDFMALVGKSISMLNAEAKLNRVAMNPGSWMVNVLGNVAALAQTGDLFSTTLFTRVAEAARLYKAGDTKNGSNINTTVEALRDARRAMVARLTASGVVGESFSARDLEASLERATVQWVEDEQAGLKNRALGAAKGALYGQAAGRGFGTTGRLVGGAVGALGGAIAGHENILAAQKRIAEYVMTAPDVLGRLTGFLGNLETAHAAGLTSDAAFQHASERTRNTFPDYSKLPAVMRTLSKFGGLGSFIGFQFEVYRNTIWNARYAYQDIRSGNTALQTRGAKRLIGLSMLGYLAAGGAQALFQNVAGTDDDRNRLWRKWFASPWEAKAPLAFTNYDSKGVTYFNTSYLVPQATIGELLRAAQEADDPANAALDLVTQVAQQFAGGSVHMTPIIEALMNTKNNSRPVTQSTGAQGVAKRVEHAAQTILYPGWTQTATNITYALRSDQPIINGKQFDIDTESAKLIGIRATTRTWDNLVTFAYKKLGSEYQRIRAEANESINAAMPGERNAAIQRANAALQALAAQVTQYEADLTKLGVPDNVAKLAKKESHIPHTFTAIEIDPTLNRVRSVKH